MAMERTSSSAWIIPDSEEILDSGEMLRQAIENRKLSRAENVFSNLGTQGLATDVLVGCLKALVTKFSNLDEPSTQNLLLQLLRYRNDDSRWDLVWNIVRNFIVQNDSGKNAYLIIVTKLFEQFPNLAAHIRSGRGKNLFHAAADEGVFEVIKIAKHSMKDRIKLSQALLQKDSGQSTPLAIAVRSQDLSTVMALVEDAEDTTPEMITPSILISTLSEGKQSILKTLIGPRVNLITIQLLEKAIPKGSIRTWQYLLDLVQPQFVDKSDLLKLAVVNQRVDIVKSLVEKNAELVLWTDENDDKRSVLYFNRNPINLVSQKQIRDIIALKIIENCPPKEIRERLKDSSGREIGLDLSVLSTCPGELQRLLGLIKAEVAVARPNPGERQSIERLQRNSGNVPSISIEFEPCLRDVVIPLFDSNAPTCPRFAPMEPRSEVKDILLWLEIKDVKRILALHVLDSFHSPHTEETIEKAVQPFKVDILDWRRMDLSIDCILLAAENVGTLSLYSSGNFAVLSHWSGDDGIGRLTKLATVTINIAHDLIGETRANEYRVKTETRLKRLKERLKAQWAYNVQIWRWGTPPNQHSDDAESEITKTAPASVIRIEPFLESYEDFVRDPGTALSRQKLDLCRTKVAIIDSGVQRANLACQSVKGASFVYNNTRESPWWLSQEPHGTQMANIIHEVDPNCELYIAKVGETKTDIRGDRVVEAIEWAISKGVDVISMSLVLFNTTDPLTTAIERATGDKGIIMLCSTADDGNNYQEVYPASHASVTAIAACNSFGKVTQWSTETGANFVFQGEDILTRADTRIQASGSSVATAMAAGVVSLTIACHRIREQTKGVNGVRRRDVVVKQILAKMVETTVEKEPKYVQPKLFFKTPGGMPISKPRLFVECLDDNFKEALT